MWDLPAMPRTLWTIIIYVLWLTRSLRGHSCEYNFIGLRDHPDKVQVKLIAHIFLFNNPLLCLWLNILADHKWGLVLLCTLFAIASAFGICIIRTVSFEAPDGLPVRLLPLWPSIWVLTWLLYQTIIAVRAVRLINMIPGGNQHVALWWAPTPRAVTPADHVGREERVCCGLIERVLVIGSSWATPWGHNQVLRIH